MNSLQVILAPEQLAELADMIAAKIAKPRPLTYVEAAKLLGVSHRTIETMVADGRIQRVPNIHRQLIPQSEIDRIIS